MDQDNHTMVHQSAMQAMNQTAIDMSVAPTITSRSTLFEGRIIDVQDLNVRLTKHDGSGVDIRRYMIHHAPCVVMLVHDVERDLYVVNREYRVGPHAYAYGCVAGFMNEDESVGQAALRELREETGITFKSEDDYRMIQVADCYSSPGLSDELAHIMVIDMYRYQLEDTQMDDDEFVANAWVSFGELLSLRVQSSNPFIAIQFEQSRRLQHCT